MNCHIIYRVVVIYFACPLHDCKQLWVHIALLFPFVKLTWFTRRELRSLNTLLFKNLDLVEANNQLGMDWNTEPFFRTAPKLFHLGIMQRLCKSGQ